VWVEYLVQELKDWTTRGHRLHILCRYLLPDNLYSKLLEREESFTRVQIPSMDKQEALEEIVLVRLARSWSDLLLLPVNLIRDM